MTFEYKIPLRRGALLSFRSEYIGDPVAQAPRIARLIALAHRLEARVQSGEVNDYAELARLAQVSPARIGQIVILAQLAPDIQEYVLFLSDEHAGLIAERELRDIAHEPLWDRQRAVFRDLLQPRRRV